MFIVGCGEKEQPLVPDEEPLEVEIVDSQAPEGESPTTVVYIAAIGVSGAPLRVGHTGTGFQEVIVERDDIIEKVVVHFQKSRVYWFRGTLEPINRSIPEYIYFNVIDDNILARPTREEQDQIIEDFRKERGIAEGAPFSIAEALEVDLRIHHNEPFKPGDEIEVVINTSFTYTENGKQKKMSFVDVIRNLTRPHIIFQSEEL